MSNDEINSYQTTEKENNEVTNKDGDEDFSMDGFNYTAAEAFVQGLAGLVNQSDVENIIRAQKQMLQRFEKTNEMLLNCNALSQSRLKQANDDFKRHCKVLSDMKKDLDYIFRKIRSIKQKLSHQYPQAYAEAPQPQRSSLAEEAEDETEMRKNKEKSQTQPETASTASMSKPTKTTTVEYVQMEETMDNGKPIENDLIKRVCSIETTNPNDSSDCTSEDTG
ncbi:kxDL motif-containing protein CG10681-like [Musca autumnalis]|uniref:kxDL motif-containing protein CG10681-like n=1 Tax=Musca autumnalis TaxID=221902 RepID=UPI003CE7EEC4